MPPLSTRRSARKQAAETSKLSEPAVAGSSPSRPAAKRRRKNTGPVTPPQQTDLDQEDEVEHGISDRDEDNQATQQIADTVIPHLNVADEDVTVARQWSNADIGRTVGSSISAFAKIAGRDWTYYIRKKSVNIGREPEGSSSRPSTELSTLSSPAVQPDDSDTAQTAVHIDLGSSKLVSRLHAIVFFNEDDDRWYVLVNGRNGVRVNDRLLKRGQRERLTSGDVLEISGTEMMFVSADEQVTIHPTYLHRVNSVNIDEDLARWNRQPHAHPEPSSQAKAEQDLPNADSQELDNQDSLAVVSSKPGRRRTPVKSPANGTKRKRSAEKKSPAYGRGIMLESTEDIDYSLDESKDIKPGNSYAGLIAHAILSTEEEMLTLNGIYDWIKRNYSYYRFSKSNWQNSIRHNLSLNTAFTKIPRRTNEPGKGMKWRILPERKEELLSGAMKPSTRGGARAASKSNPTSPALKDLSASNGFDSGQIQLNTSQQMQAPIKSSPTSHTPPPNAYPATQESFTPTRGSRISALGNSYAQTLPHLSDDTSPLPNRPRYGISDNMGSPPTLSAPILYDDSRPGNSFFTPAPQKREFKLGAPSTARLPSSFMTWSSPGMAGSIFKYGNDPTGTPLQGALSPLKNGNLASDAPLQSSSPPPVVANGSPTRSRVLAVPSSQLQENGQRVEEMDDDDDDDGMGPIDLTR